MCIANTSSVSDYVDWDKSMNLIRRLYNDGNYRISLLFGCGCFFGLRISDLLALRWKMLLNDNKFYIVEKKTRKHREILINARFQKHIRKCHDALCISDDGEYCFISQKKTVFSVQRINSIFKNINKKYGLKVEHFSTHSMRKTFGRKVVENSNGNSEMALIKLSELFNHADVSTTRRYLGLRREELLETYSLLDF